MKTIDKKKRVSKKKKIAWRKHVDINDVEEYLEDKRVEERMGKPLNIISNADLFNIDTNKKVVLTKAEKRKALANKLPKCFSMLQPLTQVPDPIIKRNRVRTKEERRDPLLKRIESLRKQKGILKAKEKQSFNDKKAYLMKKNAEKPDTFSIDVWTSDGSKDNEFADEWINAQAKVHSLRGKGKFNEVLTRRTKMKHKTKVAAIETPHPGTSYNPSFKDHQDLLKEVADNEKKIMKEEEHLARVTKTIFKKASVGDKNKTWLKEMSEGLAQYNEAEEEEDTAEDSLINVKKVQGKPKSKKQKRKKKEQILLNAELMKTKMEKKKIADIFKLKHLQKAIAKNELKTEKLRELRKKKLERKSKEAKRIGPIKFEQADILFNAPQDIKGNLLHMKTEGSLLVDRFNSLQKRSVIPPSNIFNPKKAKIKKYTRPGHKDDWKVTIAGLQK